ncbi:MAG: hypothetical protein ACJ741_05375 [Pyrinomonadaceae bacterium]
MIDARKILAPENRGVLLDVVVFVVNTILMLALTSLFANLVRQANTADTGARVGALLFFLGLTFLQPLGAILKRRRAHERTPNLSEPSPGCLFHPFFYFLSKLLFLIAASSMMVDIVFGDAPSNGSTDYFGLPPRLFTVLFLGVPALAILNTAVAYFYFWKPKRPPLFEFLETPLSESLGDACLFLNMIGYQMFWGFLMLSLTKDHSGVGDRLLTFGFTALLIYLPPRLFYLAEDGRRPSTWLWMLLANTPILLRIFFSKG